MPRRSPAFPWPHVAGYGALLAAGALALDWLDWRRMAFGRVETVWLVMLAAGFLALGVAVGARAFRAAPPAPSFDGNPAARAALGLSPRETAVLAELAAGRSNKEIARTLGVSPNTVKTHVARLYERLDAHRRTEAVAKARELGLLP